MELAPTKGERDLPSRWSSIRGVRQELGTRTRRQRRHPFFGHACVKADFGYWAKVPYWTPDEAAALSLTYLPRFVNSDTVKPFLETEPEAAEYARRMVLILRAIDINGLKQQFSPAEFIYWAESLGLRLPRQLRTAVAAVRGAGGASQNEAEELRRQNELLKTELQQCRAANKEPHVRERRSLQTMIAAMSAGRYGFKPISQRNSATSEIVSDIELLGLSLDKDTVLSHLRRAFADLDISLQDP